MIALQIERVRDDYGAGTLRPAVIPELHDMTCDMARSNHLDAGPFESLLKQKRLNGVVVVTAGAYPNLSPEQLQGLKLGRFHALPLQPAPFRLPNRRQRLIGLLRLPTSRP